MSKDALREDGNAWPDTGASLASGASKPVSESDDSFLREVLQVEPSSRLPVPGQRLGGPEGRRFEILEPMGRGGMGQVFRARDETLRREVALKFLLPRPGFEELALAEARAVARLDHENIVRIFDVAEWSHTPGDARVPFLVMECLEGESLAGLLRRERPELRRALEILEAIAAGLAHAHARGIVHRDLKPGNVFLTREGTVKLLDFGLSHLAVEPVRSKLQPAGGTPAYMAPEQWRGEPQDARTDIWAAGVVLYELLTGEPPFQGATMAELRERVTSLEPAPPVRVRHPEVPRRVAVLLTTALAKEPARRFSSALELRQEVRELRGRLFEAGRETRGAAAEPQRRQVSLVSCQLAGLAEGGASLDLEDLGELEAAFHEACVEVIERHGGTVALSMGGEVLACFGWTQGREDDSERAVRAALQLTGELRDTLGRGLPHLPLSGLFVRGGVHTEWMAVGPRLQGEAPKVAAWLARRAGPGEVVVSDTTWKLVRGAFQSEPLGSHAFEGLSGRVSLETHRVRCEREGASRFERAHVAGRLSPLVGRERELEGLLGLWEQAQRGHGAFVLVSGEAGIGKSRLIEALCERVAESSSLIRVQCWSRFTTHALHPVLEMLQLAVGIRPEEPPALRLEKLKARLGALGLSEEDRALLGLLLGLPVPEGSPVLQLSPERRKEKTFESLAHMLMSCPCEDPPRLLVIEDLHWADSSLLEFLSFLLERVGKASFLVVLSARPEFQPDWPRSEGVHRLMLERLPAGRAAALVREVARERELPEETVQTLVRKTDGIPLFIEEMTRMVLEGGAAASIPLTLHELLLARLDLLPSRQKALAQLGAVVGRVFCARMLALLSERDEITVRRDIAGLMEAGLLIERERDVEPGLDYQFRHALFQKAAYQSLSRSTRRRHHRRLVPALETHFSGLVEARPEVLAHHLTEAGEHVRAIGYWARAGRLALERQDSPEALGHLTRALELLPVLTEDARRLQRELEIRMGLGLSMLQVHGYDAPETERMFARVWELFSLVGEALPQLDLPLWALFAYYRGRSEYHRAKELAERLVDLGQRHGQWALRSLGDVMSAVILFAWGRPWEAARELARVLGRPEPSLEEHRALALRYGSDPWMMALAESTIVHAVLGRMEESRRRAREALELAGRIGHPYTLGSAQIYVAMGRLLRREPQGALPLVDRALTFASERRFVIWSTWATLVRGGALAGLGRPREGLALAQGVLEAWRGRGIHNGIPSCLSVVAQTRLALGQVQEALAAIDEALVRSAETGEIGGDTWLHLVRGECLRQAGREEEAGSCFVRALAVARAQGAGLPELRATVSLCRLLRDRGQVEAARRMLERACAGFEPGGECLDLQEARALRDELSRGEAPVWGVTSP
ncbi:putative ATPase [Archangium gephyra]|uniref:ATPase n=1 Tax=Archangium gephyra TaxID=48 RepID=A0AAC8TED9_9BACT|nr:protein kinase [Archangium gephyra]AKJ02867.1 Adenylate cyclase [Archangium gephyra]REG24993.1 putative ATPase [Archangium gephyra]